VSSPFNPPSASSQPDALDVVSAVNKFRNLTGAPKKNAVQIQPNVPDPGTDVNALDIVSIVDAFRGLAYSFSGPCACPSTVVCDATACTSAGQCSGGTCVKTCNGGPYDGQPCLTNQGCRLCVGGIYDGLPCDADSGCPGGGCSVDGVCGSGFCRDRCGRCAP
jgi:hypothetical protein